MRKQKPTLDYPATLSVAEALDRRRQEEPPFEAARHLARKLGAHVQGAGRALFGFWTPELMEEALPEEKVWLEILVPPEGVDLALEEQRLTFVRHLLPTVRRGEFTWALADGVVAGNRNRVGCFYALLYEDFSGRRRRILDPLAGSVPFGAGAPAELYDSEGVLGERGDKEYFRELETIKDSDGVSRVVGPSNMLEIHVATASDGGTLADLNRRYLSIGEKLSRGEQLTPGERSFVGYDAIQLMPVEPTILYETGPSFWAREEESDGELTVSCRRPDSSNWGYDVITVASPAPNPTLLATGRPHELLDLIVTLHTFPGAAIKVVFDVVYGHADNQTLPLLNRHYFAGANMYGQNLNYQQPMVRAVLLEMQWRKSQYGVDGVRVDGAQDFTYWVANEEKLYHDDEYLRLMNDVEQEVDGIRYRPWMVFEDGRPWPRDDWELASSYREMTRQLSNVVQWGPLTFAHNTPFLFTKWIGKWWRIQQLARHGSHWITGTSNHDTLRRGTQVDPQALINTYLGPTLPKIFKEAYDNLNVRLFDLVMPGIPMDFLNAYAPPLAEGVTFTPEVLRRIARDWMDEVLDYCKVPQYEGELDEERTAFALRLRTFRRERPWLRSSLREEEHFGRIIPEEGSIFFYILRKEPDGEEELLYVGNMEGSPRQVTPVDLPIPGLAATWWTPAVAVPGLQRPEAEGSVCLANGQGVLFSRGSGS